ncbi:MAG: histidine phosphatase family protein [Ardenticatenaceae bacterium]|nr:histidine phosphatase family protein [Ardenticatenaceae bacterium]MCB8989139.1 histidine phosphatase family protein [Ardenticatenaceae bacterium]
MVRHGQSYVNLPDWDGGNQDSPLTELGLAQAAALAAWLPQELAAVDAIYCSTMLRARQTAAPLAAAYDTPITYDDRIREIGNNRLDQSPWPSDALPEYGDFWGSERPFASITPAHTAGESLMHSRIRVGAFLEELVEKHREETVIVVCHGGVIEMTYDHVFNIGPWRRCEVITKNTGVTRFQLVEHPNRETWRLLYHSRVEHLAVNGKR